MRAEGGHGHSLIVLACTAGCSHVDTNDPADRVWPRASFNAFCGARGSHAQSFDIITSFPRNASTCVASSRHARVDLVSNIAV